VNSKKNKGAQKTEPILSQWKVWFWEKKKKVVPQKLLLVAFFYFAFLFLFGDRGFLHLILLNHRLNQLNQEVQNLKQEKEKWKFRISQSKSSNSILELTAREKLGLSYPQEYIFLIP